MSEQVSTFFWDEAPQHGLEMREGQQDMSFEIVDALINDQHFAIEAGVGIGKSFGYLVPVLLYSKRMNKRAKEMGIRDRSNGLWLHGNGIIISRQSVTRRPCCNGSTRRTAWTLSLIHISL